jgi:hypothetical protein
MNFSALLYALVGYAKLIALAGWLLIALGSIMPKISTIRMSIVLQMMIRQEASILPGSYDETRHR